MIVHWVRHGTTRAPNDQCVGHDDVSLSKSGRRSIDRLAGTWSGSSPDRVVSSDLRRAQASAEILAREWGLGVQPTDRLRELDFGRWTGRSWDDIEAEEGDRLHEWMGDWVDTAPPNGESFDALSRRVVGWLEEATATHESDAILVVVAHAGPIRAILCHILGLPMDRAFRLEVNRASVSAHTTNMREWRIVCMNAPGFRCSEGP